MSKNIKLTFCGGVGVVTGADFLMEFDQTKILVDCGFEQGGPESHKFNSAPFPYDPRSIQALYITHAHLDHVGRIPKLVKDGFSGKIYSTPETKALAELIMLDSAALLFRDAEEQGGIPLYTEKDVEDAMDLWEGIPYHTKKNAPGGLSVYLKDAGHILGSAMIEFSVAGDPKNKKIIFTGDLGNSPSPLLKNTEKITDDAYVVMESVYGDRNHEPAEDRDNKFRQIVKEIVAKKGVLVIPAFSLERTQVILYELDQMEENKEITPLPVFLDSPLAISITKIYKERALKDFNETAKKEIMSGDDIFKFPRLHFTVTTHESKAILDTPNPKIIIAGSGMSNGGRIIHHEKNYLPGRNNILLIIGYESAGTLGRQLQDGAKVVNILGEDVPVNARIESISGYSSHKDSDHLVEFVADDKSAAERVFVAMGEPKSSLFLVQRLRDEVGVRAEVPEIGETTEIQL